MDNVVLEAKVRSIGNSVGIILPKALLAKLMLEKGDSVFLVETETGSFEITPYSQEIKDTLETARAVVKRYRNAFKKLAE